MATLGLDGLARGLADPLGLLTGGARMDERHRSLRAVLDWSFGLLSSDEQAAMRRASVFATSFTAAAAAEVAGFAPLTAEKVAQALANLADHQLVVVLDRRSGTRYRMLETIRQYGAELMDRIGEQDDVRARHLRWCLATAEDLEARRGVTWRVRRGGRRSARRAWLGGRPTRVAGRGPPARRTPGTAHLCAGKAERSSGTVRGGGSACG